MNIVIDSLLGAIGAGILTLIIIAIKFIWQKMKADAYTLKALIQDAYFRNCRYLMNKESKTRDEAENNEHLYKAYKAQGMNGVGDEMYKIIKEIPLDRQTIQL